MFFKGYSQTVIDHFMEPRNNYEMTDADGVGQAGDPSCGDATGIYIKVRDGVIKEASFVVMGCVGAIASSSMTTVLLEGKSVEYAYQITPEAIADALGGLPEHKLHCSVLGAEAARNAIDNYRKRQAEADH